MNSDEVRKIALLARVALSDAEAEKFGRQFGDILGHIRKMDALDLAGTEPVSHPFDITNVFRPDRAELSAFARDILSIAPQSARGMLRVPRIIEGKS